MKCLPTTSTFLYQAQVLILKVLKMRLIEPFFIHSNFSLFPFPLFWLQFPQSQFDVSVSYLSPRLHSSKMYHFEHRVAQQHQLKLHEGNFLGVQGGKASVTIPQRDCKWQKVFFPKQKGPVIETVQQEKDVKMTVEYPSLKAYPSMQQVFRAKFFKRRKVREIPDNFANVK